MTHVPVLLDESLQFLKINPHGTYVDATLGQSGHAYAIAQQLSAQATLIGLDQDEQACQQAQLKLKDCSCSVRIFHQNFRNLSQIFEDLNLKQVHGILLDLGYSSFQLEDPEYGLSWKAEHAPLDMRLNRKENTLTAAKILNQFETQSLVSIFQNFGELRRTKTLVENIKNYRGEKKFETIADLKQVIQQTYRPIRSIQFESVYNQVFQALRIAVNQELENLNHFLETIPSYLAPEGCLAIISFHSLEDRLVKRAFNFYQRQGFEILTRKPITPTSTEIQNNSRSRSAKLRALKKI